MLYTMEFEIPLVCLILILLLMIVYFMKPNIDLVQNKFFKVMLFASLGGIFLDCVVHLICAFNPFELINSYPLFNFFNIINKFIVISYVIIFEYLFLYVLLITYGSSILKNRKLSISIMLINLLFLIMLTFTDIRIINAGTASNVVGMTPTLGYVLIALFLTASMFVTLKNFKKIDKRYIPIVVIFIVMIICYGITLVFPGMILYDFAILILCYMMFFTIENPDMNLLEEMHKAKKISDSANEEKTLFLYNMTQEVRETTNRINNEADLILSSNSLDLDKDSARNIKAETAKFNSMTNDIFDVSKIDAANIKIYNSKYNIKLILKEIVSKYNDICKAKGINFITNIEHNLVEYLYGDSIGLKKSLSSILKYVVNNTSKGYVEFNIDTIVKNDICRLIISVEASSDLIKIDDVEKIKIENPDLSLAYKTIILMNGTMLILPGGGNGNKFKIILDQKMEVKLSKDLKRYDEIYDNKRILMVDDSEAGIKIIEKLLKNSNILVDTANNGKEAIDKIRSKIKYDLILLDEQLSGITGVELLKKFNDLRNFSIPVILLTKDNSYEYNQEHENEGFADYIIKPVSKEILLNKLDKFIKK